MDTEEIRRLLHHLFRHSPCLFLGVYAADNLPSPSFICANTPCCYVSNTDPKGWPGKHWVAIYHSTNNALEFFDSFAQHPSNLGFKFHASFQVHYNHRHIQSISSHVCAHYCIFFLYYRSLGQSLNQISRFLSKMPHSKSDSFVYSFVNKIKRS